MGVLVWLGVFAVGVALLLLGGSVLVRGAVALAERLGVRPLTIGLTIVAFGTSAPELALNVAAALGGHTGLTFGNLVGSSLANVGWILGLVALLRPVKVESTLLRRELPMLLGAVLLLIALGYLPPHVGDARVGLTRLDGVVLLAAFAAVTVRTLRTAQAPAATAAGAELRAELVEVVEEVEHPPGAPLAPSVLLLVGGLALLTLGGKLGETGAVGVAAALGLSQQLVGLTVVALATTLPELVTSVVAARQGQGDLALGNVLGSNLVNLLFVLGTVAVLTDVPLPAGAGPSFGALLCFTLLLFPLSVSFDWTITRPEGALLLTCYAAFLGYEVSRALLALP